ncbi:MAG TPA: hypothetical protein VMU16_04660 [Candidatus Binataceae bacterium]|nr:hypothetical protein [Candidatus Binataceae bacterium]
MGTIGTPCHYTARCWRVAAVAAISAVAFIGGVRTARAQDDWEVVKRVPAQQAAPPATIGRPAAPAAGAAAASSYGVSVKCGEPAQPASEQYQSIMSELNGMWGTDFKIYETPMSVSPHAATGGCIFYNEKYLNMLLQKWMSINDPNATRSMLYAIFAHELGHEAHGDLDPGSADVPVKNKELAADQFAGYSVQRLGLPRLDPDQITQYYQLTGDDFVGAASDHGNGAERSAAFNNGWHRAEMGLPEASERPAGGLGEP